MYGNKVEHYFEFVLKFVQRKKLIIFLSNLSNKKIKPKNQRTKKDKKREKSKCISE